MKKQNQIKSEKERAILVNGIFVLKGTTPDGRFTLKMWKQDSDIPFEDEFFYFEKNREIYMNDKINITFGNFSL